MISENISKTKIHRNAKNLEGQVFGRLTVLALLERRTNAGSLRWLCLCICGNETAVASYDLIKKSTISCGCYRSDLGKQAAPQRFLVHGHALGQTCTRAYARWRGMVRRCTNEQDDNYKYYGGRGITVCTRWKDGEGGKHPFLCFLEDMGECPKGLTLDRKNNYGNYEPSNCQWVTRRQQVKNRRPQSEWFHPPGPRR